MTQARHHPPHEELIPRLLQGDEVALTVLLTQLRGNLLRFISHRIPSDLRSVIDADDVVQESHTRVFESLGRIRTSDYEAFERWTKAVTLNRLRDAIRWHRTLKRGGGRKRERAWGAGHDDSSVALFRRLVAPGRSPSRSVARREMVNAIQEAVDTLPTQYQQAVRLVHLDGQTVRETATTMGRTERTIHGLCRRGLARLKKHLAQRGSSESSF